MSLIGDYVYAEFCRSLEPERDDDHDLDAEREGDLLSGGTKTGQTRPPAERQEVES